MHPAMTGLLIALALTASGCQPGCGSGGQLPLDVTDSAESDTLEDAAGGGAFEFLPQQRWKADQPPARELAEECWLRPFLSPSGLVEHQLTYYTAPDIATNGELAFVVTTGPGYRDTPTTHGYIHAVDADGEERWRVGPNEMNGLDRSHLAVDRDGALIIARQIVYHDQYSSYAAKVDSQGALLWSTPLPAHEDDPTERAGWGSRAAIDDDNNLYFGVGATVASLGPDGAVRWRQLLDPHGA